MEFKNADEVLGLGFAVLIGIVVAIVVITGFLAVLIGGCFVVRAGAPPTQHIDQTSTDEAAEFTGLPISAQIVSKSYHRADQSAGEVGDSIQVAILFRNLGDRGIRAFRGRLLFADLFGDPIKLLTFTCNDEIPARDTFIWLGLLPYDPYSDTDQQLRTTDLEDVRLAMEVTDILYLDASKWEPLKEAEPVSNTIVSQAGAEGEIISTDGKTVTMLLPDGGTTTMPIEWLTEESQKRVMRLWVLQSVRLPE
jgi:hypothetical protein